MYGSMNYIVLSLGGVSGGFRGHFGGALGRIWQASSCISLVFYFFFNFSHLESISPSYLIFEFRRFVTAISSTQYPILAGLASVTTDIALFCSTPKYPL